MSCDSSHLLEVVRQKSKVGWASCLFQCKINQSVFVVPLPGFCVNRHCLPYGNITYRSKHKCCCMSHCLPSVRLSMVRPCVEHQPCQVPFTVPCRLAVSVRQTVVGFIGLMYKFFIFHIFLQQTVFLTL